MSLWLRVARAGIRRYHSDRYAGVLRSNVDVNSPDFKVDFVSG
jgi:hypothetical protein